MNKEIYYSFSEIISPIFFSSTGNQLYVYTKTDQADSRKGKLLYGLFIFLFIGFVNILHIFNNNFFSTFFKDTKFYIKKAAM